MRRLLEAAAGDLEVYLDLSGHEDTYSPSKSVRFVLESVLFPFQVYLFSQAEGDETGERTESLILEGYLGLLLPLSDHVLERVFQRVRSRPEEQSVLVTSLEASFLAALLPYALSLLAMGSFAPRVVAALQPLLALTTRWRALLSCCGIDVAVWGRGHHSGRWDRARRTGSPTASTAETTAPCPPPRPGT